MAVPLNGPRLRARSGTPKQLVVLLHGYGADGADLIEVGRQWQRWLPDAAFLAPNAPQLLPGSPGRQWFPLTFRDPTERWRGVNQAAPALDAALDAELEAQGVPANRLALVGFSQGTMMALHVGLRRAVQPAALLGYSGMVVLEDDQNPEGLKGQTRGRPPILLVHGDRDDVIPVEALFVSADALVAAELSCEWHLAIGVGHSIDAGGLRHGGLFLARAFGLPFPG